MVVMVGSSPVGFGGVRYGTVMLSWWGKIRFCCVVCLTVGHNVDIVDDYL